MPAEILDLAHSILREPVNVAVTPVASTVDTVRQSVFFVEKPDKPALLQHILRDRAIRRVLVFTRTKHGANKVVSQLNRASIHAEAIHGNKSQSARERALANFKKGSTRVLVATDIAARGIDVEDITHVVNFDLPNEPETYVHRIGRTARAGAEGVAISFCNIEEREYLRDIERLIQLRVPVESDYPYASHLPPPPPTDLTRGNNGQRRPAAPRPPSRSNGRSYSSAPAREGQSNRRRRRRPQRRPQA
jgi:ATP-dependent RNA helicase RhlE